MPTVPPPFLAPIRTGRNEPPVSMIADDATDYEDARRPSRLEQLIAAEHCPAQRQRARKLIETWRRGRLSQFNDLRENTENLPSRYVLVIDQAVDRAALAKANASPSNFELMMEDALAGYPGCTVLIRTVSGKRGGYLGWDWTRRSPRVRRLEGDSHPAVLLERAEAVYTVSSHLGFESLLWGTPVHAFGIPFYAGWGLTTDRFSAPRRHPGVPLEDLVHACLVEYSHYRNPETGASCKAEEMFDWLSLQRRMRSRFPATLYAAGFSLWKRRFVRDFLQGSNVRFVSSPEKAPASAPLAVWGRKWSGSGGQREVLLRLEDGFLRSVGLGAGLVRPLSWVVDTRGIYYDSTVPSDLENLFQATEFDTGLLARARRLREEIVAAGITKYNVGAESWKRPPKPGKVILVPGQVEADKSILYGAPRLKTNIELLKAVRSANPGAHIVYKPHPDVVQGLRSGGEGAASAWCDEVVTYARMDEMLSMVDEVHVLTSLAGFEALLRQKSVTCYGQPFYSGWALTTDIIPHGRRGRELSLDELVAVTLILYPAYVSRATGHFTTPERVLGELLEWRQEHASQRRGVLHHAVRRVYYALLRHLAPVG